MSRSRKVFPAGAHARRSRGRQLSVALVSLLVLGGIVLFGLVQTAGSRYNSNVDRFGDSFSAIPEAERPEPAAAGPGAPSPTTVLVVGSDSRISAGDPSKWEQGAQRTDAIMLAQLSGDRSFAHVVSIPRDTWVDIPGHGMAKVNAAFSYGGPPLLVQTIEKLTGVRIDHLAVVDFEGFQGVTDALGGVDIRLADGSWKRMSGTEALAYVRERKSLPNGDFDRARRQQNWVRGVLRQVIRREDLRNPANLNELLNELGGAVAVDDSFTTERLSQFLTDMRDLTVSDVKFLTVPVEGTGRSADGQSIVVLDAEAAAGLWQAMREDGAARWIEDNPKAITPNRVT